LLKINKAAATHANVFRDSLHFGAVALINQLLAQFIPDLCIYGRASAQAGKPSHFRFPISASSSLRLSGQASTSDFPLPTSDFPLRLRKIGTIFSYRVLSTLFEQKARAM